MESGHALQCVLWVWKQEVFCVKEDAVSVHLEWDFLQSPDGCWLPWSKGQILNNRQTHMTQRKGLPCCVWWPRHSELLCASTWLGAVCFRVSSVPMLHEWHPCGHFICVTSTVGWFWDTRTMADGGLEMALHSSKASQPHGCRQSHQECFENARAWPLYFEIFWVSAQRILTSQQM